jgi:hypothetical protein
LSTKESNGLSKNDNFVNTQTRTLGSVQAARARTANPEGEAEMSKKQNRTTLKPLRSGGLVQRHVLRSIKVRKQFMFLIFVMLLAACNSFTVTTLPSSAAPADSATQAPASKADADADGAWKTYTNAEAGFSIQYPANWQEQDLPDENAGQMHHIALKGPEGGVELAWGIGFGGACPQGYQPMTVANGSWPACYSQREDGTDLWSLFPPPIGDTDFSGFVYTNDTTAESRAVVLQVMSTLATGTPTTSTPVSACPAETADLKLFTNASDGYCFLYPTEHAALPPYIVAIHPNGASGGDALPGAALVQVSMEAASGRTAAQVADEKIAEAGEGFNITRTEIMIDGNQAIVVDGLPAQDPGREVFIVGDDRLYILFFEPWTPNADWFSELERLYSSVIASFHVLPRIA